jgi:phage terminase small subunit
MRRKRTRAFMSLKRPQPPKHLSADARTLWSRIVYSHDPDHFEGIYLDQLEDYCALVALERRARLRALGQFTNQRKQQRAMTAALRMVRLVAATAATMGFVSGDGDHG